MIQSVQKAIQILQIISDMGNKPIPLGEIAQKANLNKSTCAHILETLCDCGMAERISRLDGYRIGAHAYYITRNGRYHEELVEQCAPVMRWLYNKIGGHSLILATLNRGKKVVMYNISGINNLPNQKLKIYYETLYKYSTSHAYLAAMNPLERAEFYAENGFPTEDEWPKLYAPQGEKAAYDEINNRGYECFRYPYDHPSAAPDETVVGMAKAIKHDDKVVAVIGVALPNEYGRFHFENGVPWHLSEEEEKNIAKHLCAAVREIQRRLQFS